MKIETQKEVKRWGLGFPMESGFAATGLVSAVSPSGVKCCEIQKSLRKEVSSELFSPSTAAKINDDNIAQSFIGHEKRDPAGCQPAIEEFNSLIDLSAHHSCGA
jgi:hypothetical protein